MKTIEERAKEYASKKADISLSPIYNEALASIYEEAYIAGATEQLSIDIASLEKCACGSDGRESSAILRQNFFVHELQHALRLVGLSDIADNFKV